MTALWLWLLFAGAIGLDVWMIARRTPKRRRRL
jgi:hypothetical protein